MAKSTQNFRLFQLMKSGGIVSKEVIAETLGVALVSVPVYIHELKKQFKAEIVSVRNGRKVTGYKLVDKEIAVPEFRKNNAEVHPVKTKKVKNTVVKGDSELANDGSVPVLDKDAEITQVGEREFADIRESLGVGTGHGFGND